MATSQCTPHCCSCGSLELDDCVDSPRECEQEAGRGAARLERKRLVGEDMTALFQLEVCMYRDRSRSRVAVSPDERLAALCF